MSEPQYTPSLDDDHPDKWPEFSGLFAPMYHCNEHGDFWQHIEEVEEIDSTNDEVYTLKLCPTCHRSVTPLYHDGHRVMHPLTTEEAYWETYTGDDDEEAGWGEEGSVCHTCGGEHGDGWSSCACDMEEDE